MKDKNLTHIAVLLLVTVAVFLSPLPARAYDDNALTLATNNVQPQTASIELKRIPCANQASVPITISFSLDAAGTDNQTFVFARSKGGTNYIETLPAKRTVIAIAATGNTVSRTFTNVPTWGAAELVLVYQTNACATAVRTNTQIWYGENRYAPQGF